MDKYIEKISGYTPGPLVSEAQHLDAEYLANRLYHFDKTRADPEYWRKHRGRQHIQTRVNWHSRRFSTSQSRGFPRKFPNLEKRVLLSKIIPQKSAKASTAYSSQSKNFSRKTQPFSRQSSPFSRVSSPFSSAKPSKSSLIFM